MAFNKQVTKERFEYLKQIYYSNFELLKKEKEYNANLYRELEAYHNIKGILVE